MKVFVWNDLDDLTDNYHNGGGLVVFAEDLDRAVALASEKTYRIAFPTPDQSRDCSGEEGVLVFQDAGCC